MILRELYDLCSSSQFLERKMSQDRDADDMGFLYRTMGL
jgi:hypothetical protein